LLLIPAAGAVIVIAARFWSREPGAERPVAAEATPGKGAGTDDIAPRLPPRPPTPTPVTEFSDLSDLERVMQRKDRSQARWLVERVCQQMDRVLQSERHIEALLRLIRERAVESDDLEARDILLPMLRVIQHPAATKLVEEEYYRARTDDERMTLLEALARPYHDPKRAGQLAVERALNAESEEHRFRALDTIVKYANDFQVIFRTAVAVYEGTTRPEQVSQALEAITTAAQIEDAAREWTRGRLKRPRVEELDLLTSGIVGWGTANDAAQLEALANEFPAMGDQLRERAEAIRMRIRQQEREKRGDTSPPGPPEHPRKPPK